MSICFLSFIPQVQPLIPRACNYYDMDRIRINSQYQNEKGYWRVPAVRCTEAKLPDIGKSPTPGWKTWVKTRLSWATRRFICLSVRRFVVPQGNRCCGFPLKYFMYLLRFLRRKKKSGSQRDKSAWKSQFTANQMKYQFCFWFSREVNVERKKKKRIDYHFHELFVLKSFGQHEA